MSFDSKKFKIVKQISRKDILFSVARFENSSRVVVGSSDAKLYTLDALAEKPEAKAWEGGHQSYVSGLVMTPKHVVSGSWDGKLIWWNREKGKPEKQVDAHKRWIRRLTQSPNGKMIASVSDDMVCRLWDSTSGKLIRELKGHKPRTPHHFPSMLFTVRFSPDGKYLATADKVGHIVVWEGATGKQLKTMEAPKMYTWDPKQRIHSIGGIRSIAFSPDSKQLAVGGIGQIGNIDHLGAMARLEVFDWQKGERTHEFPGDKYKGLIERLHFDKDGKWLFAAGGDHGGFFKFFDLKTKKVVHQDKAPMHVHDVEFDEKQSHLYAAGHGKLVVWKLG